MTFFKDKSVFECWQDNFSSLCRKNPYGLFVHRDVLCRQVPPKVPGDKTNQIPLKTTSIKFIFLKKNLCAAFALLSAPFSSR